VAVAVFVSLVNAMLPATLKAITQMYVSLKFHPAHISHTNHSVQ
jgi:hypothetical protein